MSTLKIALVSLNQSWEDKSSNKDKVLNTLSLLEKYYVDWVIFPEMTLTSFTMNSSAIKEYVNASDTIHFFGECAKKYRVSIVFGVVLAQDNKATNNLVVVNKSGVLISQYAKIHPFSYAKENNYYIGGTDFVVAQIDNEVVGLSICYDLRFPELHQILSKDCKIIINIANWPAKRIEHWNALLKARAIENQVFMVGVNRIGTDGNGLDYEKSSQVVSPYGEVLQGTKIFDEIDIFELDTTQVDEYRNSFPVKNDRKIDLYKKCL